MAEAAFLAGVSEDTVADCLEAGVLEHVPLARGDRLGVLIRTRDVEAFARAGRVPKTGRPGTSA